MSSIVFNLQAFDKYAERWEMAGETDYKTLTLGLNMTFGMSDISV